LHQKSWNRWEILRRWRIQPSSISWYPIDIDRFAEKLSQGGEFFRVNRRLGGAANIIAGLFVGAPFLPGLFRPTIDDHSFGQRIKRNP
jgi:hypothetical protein